MQLNTDRCVFRQQYGSTDCAAYLMSQGADVNNTNTYGNTALDLAAKVSECECDRCN